MCHPYRLTVQNYKKKWLAPNFFAKKCKKNALFYLLLTKLYLLQNKNAKKNRAALTRCPIGRSLKINHYEKNKILLLPLTKHDAKILLYIYNSK